ncbi:hypothetical protein, partial [Collinsella stercoris]|uniref:hypothetical protein n=1 Tax=Collinsella stercoris TaxID=147206 RepID=UPI003AF1AC10
SESTTYVQALLNSSIGEACLSFLSPTLNCNPNEVGGIPVLNASLSTRQKIDQLARVACGASQADWDTQETSWDFKRNPLI